MGIRSSKREVGNTAGELIQLTGIGDQLEVANALTDGDWKLVSVDDAPEGAPSRCR
jgi:hypothetical protein